MKFWTIETKATEEVIGCEMTKKAAVEAAAKMGFDRSEIILSTHEVAVTAENIRRLLGNIGGYCDKSTWPDEL